MKSLLESLSVLSPELVATHQRLISIRRQLAGIASKPKVSKSEARALMEELRSIDAKRVDGKFLGPGGSSVPEGQALCGGLLEENFDICQDILAKQEDVAIPLKSVYDRLTEMRAQLERLVLTHRWTLRETDLYNFQVSLAEIDRMRVDGKFVDAEGKKPEGQLVSPTAACHLCVFWTDVLLTKVLLYLLRRCCKSLALAVFPALAVAARAVSLLLAFIRTLLHISMPLGVGAGNGKVSECCYAPESDTQPQLGDTDCSFADSSLTNDDVLRICRWPHIQTHGIQRGHQRGACADSQRKCFMATTYFTVDLDCGVGRSSALSNDVV